MTQRVISHLPTSFRCNTSHSCFLLQLHESLVSDSSCSIHLFSVDPWPLLRRPSSLPVWFRSDTDMTSALRGLTKAQQNIDKSWTKGGLKIWKLSGHHVSIAFWGNRLLPSKTDVVRPLPSAFFSPKLLAALFIHFQRAVIIPSNFGTGTLFSWRDIDMRKGCVVLKFQRRSPDLSVVIPPMFP